MDHISLSILIPVHNFNVTELVYDLHMQALECKVNFEIRCYDDGSDDEYKLLNKDIGNLQGVVYSELDENVGRSKIRNLLADDAEHNYLLFMDCDSETTTKDYVQNYVNNCSNEVVVYGGRAYYDVPPDNPAHYFRWYYGIKREQIDVNQRKKYPYRSFMTNNFLIPKTMYQSIRMDENIKGYGHEDTLFGKHIMERKVSVVHIDNPLVHIGLEETEEFIDKTQQGLHNLAWMIKEGLAYDEIKLYRYYRYFTRLGLRSVIINRFEARKEKILDNLYSAEPNLKNFDFYKLGYLMKIMG